MPRDGRRIVGGEILQYVAVGSPALGEPFSMFYKTAKMTAADGGRAGDSKRTTTRNGGGLVCRGQQVKCAAGGGGDGGRIGGERGGAL